jgi:hypothetical protein
LCYSVVLFSCVIQLCYSVAFQSGDSVVLLVLSVYYSVVV